MCERCLGRGDACLCARLGSTTSRTGVLVLQHVLEQGKVSNTARFAKLVLSSCELRVWGEAGAPRSLPALEDAWLVFPGDTPSKPAGSPKTLVFLDASWSQARRMSQRMPELRALPRLSLAGTEGERLRAGPEGTLSTLEAIAAALELVGEGEPAQVLQHTHELLCERQRALRGYVGPQQ